MNLAIGLFLVVLGVFSDCANVKRNNDKPERSSPETRVYGGSKAVEIKYKFIIFSLYMKDDWSLLKCSGVLIKPDWALFPAHCFGGCSTSRNNSKVILAGGKTDLSDYFEERLKNFFDYDILESEFGVQERRAEYVYVHEGYYFKTLENDIALVRTTEPFKIGDTLQIVPISNSEIRLHPSCKIVGYEWETISDYDYWYDRYTTKYKVEMFADDVLVLEGCRSKKENFICIEGGKYRFTCREQFALFCDGKVWGVAANSTSSLCDEIEEDLLTKLYPYHEWVEETMAKAERKAILITENQKHCGTVSEFVIIAFISGIGFFFFWLIIFTVLSKRRKWCFARNVVEPAYSPLLAAYASEDDDEDVVIDKTGKSPIDEN